MYLSTFHDFLKTFWQHFSTIIRNGWGTINLINLISKTYKAKYLYRYIQLRHKGKQQTNKQTKQNKYKTIILLIIKIMNNYDNKNDKIK